ncbi:MAG: hypothetical protein CME20_19395 [Gemmatimonadetes bacterium]|nr:hypothetical protein [Gemmatimonadota bacterium]
MPSLFSKEGQAQATLGGPELAPSVLPEGQREFLMGPLALDQGIAAAPSAQAAAASGDVSASGGGITPRRAFLYSVLVPGLGEWMAGARKRALVFFGVEALTLGLWSSWTGKGNDAEDEFRAVADENWDPLDYIVWRGSRNARNSSITHALPCSSYVDTYLETGKFTGCDDTEIQQYYELLGKYDQFVAGWGDLVRVDTENPVEPTAVDSVENFHSALRLSYEDQRNESNRYLKRASTITGLILINHVFSAIDAARVARARSEGVDEAALRRRTRVEMVMQPWQRGYVPMLMAYKPFD